MSSKKALFSSLFLIIILLSFSSLVTASNAKSHNLALYHLTPKQYLCRCEAFDYEFLVANTGSSNETYSFSVSSYFSSFNISPSILNLGPNETAKIGIGARLPCSLVSDPKIMFVARTRFTRLKAETPLQFSINSSCFSQDVNITALQGMEKKLKVPEKVKLFSFFLIILIFSSLIFLFILILKKPERKEDYWWKPYFRVKEEAPERKTSMIEVITIVIVLVLLLLLGLKGIREVGKNESLITTYIGPMVKENVTPINVTIPNVTTAPINLTNLSVVFLPVKTLFFTYSFYVLLFFILLVLVVLFSVFIIRRKARPEAMSRKKGDTENAQAKRNYVLIFFLAIFLFSIAASIFFIYKNRAKIFSVLSGISSRFGLAKLRGIFMGYLKEGFALIKPYLIYVFIGLVLLVVIIFLLRKRENSSDS